MNNTHENNFNFNYVWEEWIIPIIEECYDKVDKEFRNFVKMEKLNLSLLEKKCEKFAQEMRQSFKVEHYGKFENDINNKHLSFSKLSSIICATLIEHKVFYFNTNKLDFFVEQHNIDEKNTKWLVDNILINYKVAFYSSLSFLYHSMEYKLDKLHMTDAYNKLIKQEQLKLYDSEMLDNTNKQEPFSNYMIITLAKNDNKMLKFDYFMYSAIMLGIQEYNLKNII